MSWKQEAREAMQGLYGGYCSMMKTMGDQPVAYHQFNMNVYEQTKEAYKAWKLINTQKTKDW